MVMYEFLDYQVADAMTYRPLTVSPGTPLAEVEALFERHDFNSLPVVSRDGILLGLVTKLDFLQAFAFTPQEVVPHYDEIMCRPAQSVMTGDPITVRPDIPLTRLLQLMVDTRHRSFPVTIGALLIGIVARQDVVRALRRAAAGEGPKLRRTHPDCNRKPALAASGRSQQVKEAVA
jgi:CBS domain-containing protein